MTSRQSRIALAGVAVALVVVLGGLVWALSRHSGHRAPHAQSATPSASTSPTASATPVVLSRGQQVATLPDSCRDSDAATVACRYVIALASPDTHLDASQLASWRRTEPFSTPALYARNKGVREPAGDMWWTNLGKQDGWVEPVIDNVIGNDLQAPGPRSSQAANGVLTVIYHRVIHTNGTTTVTDTAVRQATVHLTHDAHPLVSSVDLA